MRVERRGIAISPGIAVGKAVLLDRSKTIVRMTGIEKSQIASEKDRFKSAVEQSKQELLSIKEKLGEGESGEHHQILNFNIMMLEDELLSEKVITHIESERVSAGWAVNTVLSRKSEAFKDIEDIHMKERLADIYYLGERILRNLQGVGEEVAELVEDSILITHDISALDVVLYAKHGAMGIVTETGSHTSHSAIAAKSLGIPAVMGLRDITLRASPGVDIFIDGFTGTVILDPSKKELREFRKRKSEYLDSEKKLLQYAKLKGITKDGKKVKVNANIEITEELGHAMCYGAEGIGMYRTEFLFANSVYFPDEEKQLENYQKVVSALSSPDVTIRTLDIGGDKFPSGMEATKMLNPALGLRGIRYSLHDPEMFSTQISAMLRSSGEKKIRILIPMISKLSELMDTKRIISGIAERLGKEDSWEIGVMIETPAAAIIARDIAEEVDFLSIGTNDLIQYTLAVDRINEQVSYLYTPFHPAILRLTKSVIEAGHEAGIPVCVCGEMASQLSCVPLLVGMGVDELSMNTHSIPKVKKLLNTITEKESQKLLKHSLKLKTEYEIREYVREAVISKWGDNFPTEFIIEIKSSI